MSLVFHVFIRLALFSASIAMFVPFVAANVPVLESCPQYQHPANPADIIGMVRDVESDELLYCEYHVFDKSDDTAQANKKPKV